MLVVRDAAWIEREYDREKWSDVLRLIEASDETDLSRLMAQIERHEFGDEAVAYGGFYSLVTQTLLTACDEAKPDLIVELGAGWGRNLFRLWLNGGPRSAQYVALELTKSGRHSAWEASLRQTGMKFKALPFDFYDPHPSDELSRRTLVFTCFGIAEIPRLPPAMLPFMTSLGEHVTGVHFEPHATDYAKRHDYNQDFFPLMREAHNTGRITITNYHPNIYAANPDNPCGLVQWRSR